MQLFNASVTAIFQIVFVVSRRLWRIAANLCSASLCYLLQEKHFHENFVLRFVERELGVTLCVASQELFVMRPPSRSVQLIPEG